MYYVILLRYNNQCPKKVTALSLLYKHGGKKLICFILATVMWLPHKILRKVV